MPSCTPKRPTSSHRGTSLFTVFAVCVVGLDPPSCVSLEKLTPQTKRVARRRQYKDREGKSMLTPKTKIFWKRRCRCNACGKKTKNLCFDHDHDRLSSRGELCRYCNLSEGHARATVAKLLDLKDYDKLPKSELLTPGAIRLRAEEWKKRLSNRKSRPTDVPVQKLINYLNRKSSSARSLLSLLKGE